MSLALGRRALMHARKPSPKISLCSPNRLIRDDTFCLNWIFTEKSRLLNKNTTKADSVVIDYRQSVGTARANLGRHFTHLQYNPISPRARTNCDPSFNQHITAPAVCTQCGVQTFYLTPHYRRRIAIPSESKQYYIGINSLITFLKQYRVIVNYKQN